MYLTTAESGAALSDALTETDEGLNVISKLSGTEYRKPKDGPRISGVRPRWLLQGLQGYYKNCNGKKQPLRPLQGT